MFNSGVLNTTSDHRLLLLFFLMFKSQSFQYSLSAITRDIFNFVSSNYNNRVITIIIIFQLFRFSCKIPKCFAQPIKIKITFIHVSGHTRKISIPGCVEFRITTNACRGYCESWAVPSPADTVIINPNQRITSVGQCCNIMDTEDVSSKRIRPCNSTFIFPVWVRAHLIIRRIFWKTVNLGSEPKRSNLILWLDKIIFKWLKNVTIG